MRYIYFFLLFCCSLCYGQIEELDRSKGQLRGYDIYFIGEEHGFNDADIIESRLIDMLYTSTTRVLMEGPYDRNFGLKKVFEEKDTSVYEFAAFNPSKVNLFRYIYFNNIPFKLNDVVMFNGFFKDELIDVLDAKIKSEALKKDILYFKKTGALKFPVKRKNMKRYLKYVELYKQKRQLYSDALGADFYRVDECIQALEASIKTKRAPNEVERLWSADRESFMFSLLAKEVKRGHKVISINGAGHTFLEEKVKWLPSTKGWTPLAYRAKEGFPDKKVCSIWIWNRKDKLFQEYFPDASTYILEHTEPGKTYIITIDDKDGPLKQINGKFTHILVY